MTRWRTARRGTREHPVFLQTVVWLSELRNFRVTADRMNITPAAISNRISAIEQELGIKLFERDTRDVRLTSEGVTFVRRGAGYHRAL